MTEINYEQGIIEELPQIPYVVDQVDDALKWAKETLSEGDYNKLLKVAYDVTKFVKSISEPNFFKTHLVVASILSNIPDATTNERFKRFDTASKATENAYNLLNIDPNEIEKHGCFKTTLLHLVPLAKENEDLFAISLIGIKHDLKEIVAGMEVAGVKTPITAPDYITILGYALIMANIRMSNLKLLDRTHTIYNEVLILLNSLQY